MGKRTMLAAVAMLAALAAGAVRGVAEGRTEAAAKPAQPATVTFLYAENANLPYKETFPLKRVVREQLNIDLVVQSVPDNDYPTKAKLLLNSGDAPDIVSKVPDYDTYASSGAFVAVSDHGAKTPNFARVIGDPKLADEIANLRMADGKLYGWPRIWEMANTNYGFLVRRDLLAKYGVAEWRSTDQLYDALKKIRDGEASAGKTLLGLGNPNGLDNLLQAFSGMFNTQGGWTYGNGFTLDRPSNTWRFSATSDSHKAMLQYVRRLVRDKLLDVESLTQDVRQFEDKFANGLYIGGFAWYGGLKTRVEPKGKQLVGPQFEIAQVNVPDGGFGRSGFVAPRVQWMQVVPKTRPGKASLDTLLAFADFMYSDAGKVLTSWGIEGETFRRQGDRIVALDTIASARNPKGTLDPRKEYGTTNNSLTWLMHRDAVLEFFVPNEDYILAAEKAGKVLSPPPRILLSVQEIDQESRFAPDLRSYVAEMQAKFITGVASLENDWATFVATCDRKGVPQLGELYNRAWKSMKR